MKKSFKPWKAARKDRSLPEMQQEFVIALGANLPSPAGSTVETLAAALAALRHKSFTLKCLSRFFRTPCFPPGAGPDFVNAVAVLTPVGARMTPDSVLSRLHAVEAEFGRERKLRWGTRTLDLDLIAMGDVVAPDPGTEAHWRGLSPELQRTEMPDRLILPHPRLAERGFVLVPFRDVRPDWRHPVTGRTVREMTRALGARELAEIVPLSADPALVKSV